MKSKPNRNFCKKDEGVAIMLKDGGKLGFENQLWDNVAKRSMGNGGIVETEWVAEFTKNGEHRKAVSVTVTASGRAQAIIKAWKKAGLLRRNYTINIYEKMKKGSNVKTKQMGVGGVVLLAGVGMLAYMALARKGEKNNQKIQEYQVRIYDNSKLKDTLVFEEPYLEQALSDYEKLGYTTKVSKISAMKVGGTVHYSIEDIWNYEIGGL